MPIDDNTLQRLRDNDPTLTSLNLASNKIGENEVKTLAGVLEKNTTLRSLNLDSNQIGAEGAKALGETLQKNTTLTMLGLGGNQVSDEGAKALGEALAKNTGLTQLNLDDNQISDEGEKELAKALAKNTSLTTLYLDNNQISDEGGNEFVKVLVTNTTLTALDCACEAEMSEELWEQILCLLGRNEQYLKELQTTVYEQLRIGRIILYKTLISGQNENSILTLPLKLREKVVESLSRNVLMTKEQQRLVLSYTEGKIAPVADKLSFFKMTKCDRVMKPLQVSEQTVEPPAKRVCLSLS